MGAISFALPYTPETVAKGYEFIAELTGQRADEHHQRHKLHGLQNLKIWRQHHPVEVVIVYIEADNIEEMLESRRKADHAFEQWFDEQVVGITGYHWADAKGELLMDWHHEEGHRHHAPVHA